MYNEVIVLLKERAQIDEYGDMILITERNEIFADIRSIGQTEFYQAKAVGVKPEIKFVIADYYDYAGEEKLEYDEEVYRIIRTYRNGNTLEITASRGVD